MPHIIIIDAMNVIGATPDGWWRDRDGAARRLVERVQRLAAVEGGPVTVVLDGRPIADLPEGEHGGVRVLYALRGGRDAADDRIVEVVAGTADAEALVVVVVTSDRGLAERVRAHGATVHGVRWLLGRLEEADGGRE